MKLIFLDNASSFRKNEINFGEFNKLGDLVLCSNVTEEPEILNVCKDADVILLNKVKLNKSIIEKLPDTVKLIAMTATGYDNVDIDFAKSRGIMVCNVPNYSTQSVAGLVMLFILNFATNFSKRLIKNGTNGWIDKNRLEIPMYELTGKSLGIVGYGNIGKQIAKLGLAFGMHILVYSKSQKKDNASVEFVNLFDLAQRSDFISLNSALNKDNIGIINSEFLSQMKKTAFLINTARGGLVDEVALISALQNQQIAGAGLDVLIEEPPHVDNPLLNMDNVILTPHIAWSAIEARQRCIDITIHNIENFIAGNPINLVT